MTCKIFESINLSVWMNLFKRMLYESLYFNRAIVKLKSLMFFRVFLSNVYIGSLEQQLGNDLGLFFDHYSNELHISEADLGLLQHPRWSAL